jgi:hypothetical protein
MNLVTEIERWHKYWTTVKDADDAERQLCRLCWLDDFAFHCGGAITAEEFRTLQQQIEIGQRKLAELCGEQPVELESAVPKTTRNHTLRTFENAWPAHDEIAVTKTHDFHMGANE